MVRSFLIVLLTTFVYFANAQELKWIYKIGGVSADNGNGLAIDSDQNIYDITNIMGTVSVAPMVTYTSRGDEDILIRKSTSLGILQWVRQVGGIGQDLAYDVAVDNDKNVFVVGTFKDTLYMGNDVLLAGSPDRVQSFVLKLSAAGTMLWVKKLESNISVTAKCVTAGAADELLVSGTFEGNASFGVGFPGFSDGGNDIFLLKLDGASGNPIFVRRIGGTDHEYIHQHVRDQDNNIYLTGDFRSNVDLDPGASSFIVNSNGLTDAFLVKLSGSGTFQWAKTYGSIGVDYGTSVITDSENNIIITGRYSDNISFGSVNHTLTSKGGTDIYLTKLNSAGNTIWTNGYGDTQNDQPTKVIVNKNGIIYLGGTFRGKVDFDPSIAFNNSSESNGGADVFIALFNQDGSYNDHFSLGGIANDQLADLALKTNGELISSGGFGAIADFDPTSSEVNIFSNGGLDGFLWNTFVCVNPYLKTFQAAKTELCPGEKVFIQITEGYLNDATQWSWQRDTCNSITFASGDFLSIDVDTNTTFLIKGFGGCVVNDQCKKIDIKVFKDSLVYQYKDLCQGDTIFVGNNAYTFGGVFIDSLQSTSGCDSVVVTEISTYPTYNFSVNTQICNGDTVKVGNFNYTLAGTYLTPLTSIFGCDSIIRTSITVLPSSIENVEATLCKGDSIKIANVVYRNEGTYIQTSTGSNGCEDQLIIKIDILETEFNNVISICQGDSIKVGNSIYKSDGIFTDRLISTFGCDSLITTILTVKNTSVFQQDIAFCQGDSIVVGNTVHKNTGNFIDTLINIVGCDSIVFTDIRVYPLPLPFNQNLRICEGSSVVVGNHVYTSTGIFVDTLLSINGCDSIVNTSLIVDQREYNVNAEICEGDFVNIGDQSFSSTGIFEVPFINDFGCDSIIVLNLIVNPTVATAQSFIICPGETINVGNNAYTNAGIYIDTLSGIKGCDSIVTTTITFNHVEKNLSFEICQGELITINNKVYNTQGLFRDTLLKTDGCDSILLISLIIHPTYVKDTIFEICKGSSIKIGNSTYFNAGNFIEILQSNKGCDSLINFEIKIVNFAPIFSVVRDTLRTFKLEGAQYQWHECRNDEIIPFFGAVQSDFVILKSGRYALSITYKGCTYFSDCIDVVISSNNDINELSFKYYPNPFSNAIYIETESAGTLSLISSFGQILGNYEISNDNHIVDVADYLPGSYYLMFRSQGKVSYHKVIKL